MDPVELARLMKRASDIHEANYDRGAMRYAKDWRQCCLETGMPAVWADLLAPYMSLGYCETWDWVDVQLKAAPLTVVR